MKLGDEDLLNRQVEADLAGVSQPWLELQNPEGGTKGPCAS